MDKQLRGSIVSFIGVTFYAFDSLLLAMSGAAGFTAGFWRGFFSFISLGIAFIISTKGKPFAVLAKYGLPMLFSGAMLGFAGAMYSFSISYGGTSISLVMLSLNPILTAFFCYIFLKEKPSKHTVVIMFICLFAVIYMFWDGIKNGNVLGYLIALVVPIALALNMTNLRRFPDLPRIGVSMIGGLVTAIIGLVVSMGNLKVPGNGLIYLALLGIVIIPVGQVMITTGTKYAKAATISLINSLESIFGLIYVWIFMGTIPSINCLIGGSIIMLSVVMNIIFDAKAFSDEQIYIKTEQKGIGLQ